MVWRTMRLFIRLCQDNHVVSMYGKINSEYGGQHHLLRHDLVKPHCGYIVRPHKILWSAYLSLHWASYNNIQLVVVVHDLTMNVIKDNKM